MTDEVKAYMESLGFQRVADDKDSPMNLRSWWSPSEGLIVGQRQAEFFYDAEKKSIRSVLAEVEKRIIGEDGEPHYDSDNAQETGYKYGQDDLREEQRQTLQAMRQERGL